MKILLVGESNPHSSLPSHALYPSPPGSAGHRLCHAILGMGLIEYLRTFDRINLCHGRWSLPVARKFAATLGFRPRILLGAKVTAAHNLKFAPFTRIQPRDGTDSITFDGYIWPHPSGLSRGWNDPSSIACARDQLRQFTKRVTEL